MIVPMTCLGAVATYVWPYVQTKDGLIAIVVLYGCGNNRKYPLTKVLQLLQLHDRCIRIFVSNAPVRIR